MKITYIAKGKEYNYRRFGDHLETVDLFRCWRSGGLLYGYKDRFNVVVIPYEDITEIVETLADI